MKERRKKINERNLLIYVFSFCYFSNKKKYYVKKLQNSKNLERSINHEGLEESNKFGVAVDCDFANKTLHELPLWSRLIDQVLNELSDTGCKLIFLVFQDCKSEESEKKEFNSGNHCSLNITKKILVSLLDIEQNKCW